MNNRLFVIVAILSWGIWGILNKVSQSYIPPLQAALFGALANLVTVAAFILASSPSQPVQLNFSGIGFATAAGILGALANCAYLYALISGGAGVVTGLTSVYPVITALISFLILGESLHLNHVLGFLLISIGSWALSLNR